MYELLCSSKNFFKLDLLLESANCCEAPRSRLSNYFCTKQELRENPAHTYPNIPSNFIEPKYGAFYLHNEVRVHGLVLLVQLS